VQFGGVLTNRTGVSPAFTIWPWFAILAFGSLLLTALQDSLTGRPMEYPGVAWHYLRHRLRAVLTFFRKGYAAT
jgi:hypothetical protein